MLVLLGVALFCVLTTLGSPDKLLLAADSTIKVPFADAPMSFLGFIVVAPILLIVLAIYLHVFYGYWLECERDRLYINQRLIPPIESIPTLFSFPDVISRLLTQGIFYWLVPLVLVITRIGLLLTYVSGIVTIGLVVLLFRRRHDNQRKSWAPLRDTILFLIIGLMVGATVTPQWFQRPFDLFRAELPKAWLVGINMSRARADFANLEGANLEGANLEGANLEGANLQGANFRETIGLARWQLSGAHNATLAFYSPVLLTALKLPPDHNEKLKDKNLAQYDLSQANLQGAKLGKADLQQANLQGANLNRATLVGANLSGATLVGARFLSQDQVDGACVDEHTKLSAGLRKPPQCPAR